VAVGPVLRLNPMAHARQQIVEIRAPHASFVEVLLRRYRLRPNEPGRGGSHVLIGRNRHGDCLAIPVQRDFLPGEWVAITVWRSDAEEERALGN
jgi:hypothetical protein